MLKSQNLCERKSRLQAAEQVVYISSTEESCRQQIVSFSKRIPYLSKYVESLTRNPMFSADVIIYSLGHQIKSGTAIVRTCSEYYSHALSNAAVVNSDFFFYHHCDVSSFGGTTS